MRSRWIVFPLLLVFLTGTACERKGEEQKDRVLNAITGTESRPRRFDFTQRLGSLELSVKATVRDDLAYSINVLAGGQPIYEEAVRDDARAIRLLNADALPLLNRGGTEQTQPVFQQLQGGGWVLDPVGSAAFTPPDRNRTSGDIVFQALTALRATADAVTSAPEVVLFNPAASPYPRREDPFTPPKLKEGELRYDLIQPAMPPRQDPRTAQPGQGPQYPGAEHFRKMAIYIRDGKVIRVEEVIDPTRRLDQLTVRLQDANVLVPPGGTLSERMRNRINALNQLRAASGLVPVILRSMRLTFQDLGKELSVSLPTDAVQASLKGFMDRGQVLEQAGG